MGVSQQIVLGKEGQERRELSPCVQSKAVQLHAWCPSLGSGGEQEREAEGACLPALGVAQAAHSGHRTGLSSIGEGA